MAHSLVDVRLYDLEADPLELSPVDDPERVADLQAQLAEWEASNSPDGMRNASLSDQQLLKLHQLGYGGEAEHVKKFIDSVEERVRAKEEAEGDSQDASGSAPEEGPGEGPEEGR